MRIVFQIEGDFRRPGNQFGDRASVGAFGLDAEFFHDRWRQLDRTLVAVTVLPVALVTIMIVTSIGVLFGTVVVLLFHLPSPSDGDLMAARTTFRRVIMFFAAFGFPRVRVVLVRIVGLALVVVLFRSRMRRRQGADQQVVLLSILYRDDDFIIGSSQVSATSGPVNVDTPCFFSGAARLPVDGEPEFCPDNGSSIGRPRQADR